jgi:hypothetical protein
MLKPGRAGGEEGKGNPVYTCRSSPTGPGRITRITSSLHGSPFAWRLPTGLAHKSKHGDKMLTSCGSPLVYVSISSTLYT